MSNARRAGVLAAAAVAAVAVSGAALASAATPSPVVPRIVAVPNNVMVNTNTALTGVGFAPNSTLHVVECGTTSWIAPQNPCDTTNAINVTTNAAGGFHAVFKVQLCPRVVPPPTAVPITEEQCYIGVPKPTGIDTIALEGAAPVIVTYP
jgi:hypothetical protein